MPDQEDAQLVATPAAPDMVCWLWAAFPSKRGRLDTASIATHFGVHPSTVRRWIRENHSRRLKDALPSLQKQALTRGEGRYLWPPLDPASRRRSAAEDRTAQDSCDAIAAGSYPPAWKTNGTLDEHRVLEVRWPVAGVRTITVTRTHESEARIPRKGGDIIDSTTARHLYEADALKHQLLAQVDDQQRCIPPRSLVPFGRTYAWHETAADDDRDLAQGRAATDALLAARWAQTKADLLRELRRSGDRVRITRR